MAKQNHNAEILKGIPRGVFVDLWATEQEEKGRSFSGMNLDDVAPATPAWAKKWARQVADNIVEANGHSLEDLYELVVSNGYPHDRETFGYHLGMQTSGHGVSWSDDVPHTKLHHDAIKIPHREFYR